MEKPTTRKTLVVATRYDVMPFAAPGESPLRCRQDDRKVSHAHQDVAIIKKPTPQPGHAINLRAKQCGGNSEPNGRALAGAKGRGSQDRSALASIAALPCCAPAVKKCLTFINPWR